MAAARAGAAQRSASDIVDEHTCVAHWHNLQWSRPLAQLFFFWLHLQWSRPKRESCLQFLPNPMLPDPIFCKSLGLTSLYAKVLLMIKFALIATTSTRLIMTRLRNGHGLHAQWCARGAAAAGACWPSPPSAWCSRCVLTSPAVGTALQVRRLVRRPGSRQRLRRRQR